MKGKKHLQTFRLLFISIFMIWGFLLNTQDVHADLILDNVLIEGSYHIYYNQQPLREIQYNGTVVWRAGADITYVIDNDVSEVHFVPYGQSTLEYSYGKEGYEFVGWRTDTEASGDVLTTDLCTGDEKTLYAVFRKPITVTCYNGSSIEQTTVGHIYYNNGNINNPEFTIEQATLDGWTAHGWSTSPNANAEVTYAELDHTVFTTDITLYGLYQKYVTATFDGNGATSGSVGPLTKAAYYNSAGNIINPLFQMPQNSFKKTDYAWVGWMEDSTKLVYAPGENVTLSTDSIFRAKWQIIIEKDFGNSGDTQQWVVPATGYYKLEVWGAEGGTGHDGGGGGDINGGKGGYSVGYVYLNEGDQLNIVVGGQGKTPGSSRKEVEGDWDDEHDVYYDTTISGGYNGGGMGGTYHNDENNWDYKQGSGGGATHIALGNTNRGVLANYDSFRSEVLIVAGGGGGGSCKADTSAGPGGSGGGLSGGTNSYADNRVSNQTTGYKFGVGADYSHSGGGGGGWFGGYNGAGGSGYIGGCLSTLTYGSSTYTSSTVAGNNSGNGKAKITYIGF